MHRVGFAAVLVIRTVQLPNGDSVERYDVAAGELN
jgi:hypothetical protein